MQTFTLSVAIEAAKLAALERLLTIVHTSKSEREARLAASAIINMRHDAKSSNASIPSPDVPAKVTSPSRPTTSQPSAGKVEVPPRSMGSPLFSIQHPLARPLEEVLIPPSRVSVPLSGTSTRPGVTSLLHRAGHAAAGPPGLAA